jgi:hypothetical protein
MRWLRAEGSEVVTSRAGDVSMHFAIHACMCQLGSHRLLCFEHADSKDGPVVSLGCLLFADV